MDKDVVQILCVDLLYMKCCNTGLMLSCGL